MNEPNRFQKILGETAFCKTHLTSKVSRNPKTNAWPVTCARGGYLRKIGEEPKCSIIIEGDGYTIQ